MQNLFQILVMITTFNFLLQMANRSRREADKSNAIRYQRADQQTDIVWICHREVMQLWRAASSCRGACEIPSVIGRRLV